MNQVTLCFYFRIDSDGGRRHHGIALNRFLVYFHFPDRFHRRGSAGKSRDVDIYRHRHLDKHQFIRKNPSFSVSRRYPDRPFGHAVQTLDRPG